MELAHDIKEFLEREDIIENLDKNDFEYIYAKAYLALAPAAIGVLTATFEDCEIYPLQYMLESKRIPASYRENHEHISDIDRIPDLRNIGPRAYLATSIKKLDIPEGVTIINHHAFSYTDINEIILPSTIQMIGPEAFSWTRTRSVTFRGTTKQFKSTGLQYNKKLEWIKGSLIQVIECTDGIVGLPIS